MEYTKQTNNRLNHFLLGFISVIALLFLFIILYGITHNTVYLDENYGVYFTPPLKKYYLIVLAVRIMLILCVALFTARLNITKKTFFILFILHFIFNVIFTFVMCLWPTYDQYYMTWIASSMLEGDYSQFKPYGYMDLFPAQFGFLKYIYFIFKLFGPNNYIIVQLINVVLLSLFIYLMVCISQFFVGFDKYKVGLFLIFFSPLSFYTQYIYGIIPAMTLSGVSIFFLLRYLNNYGKKWVNIIFIAISNTLSIILKTNSLIIMIAIICVLVLHCINIKNIKDILINLCIILLMLGLYLMSNKFMNAELSRYTERSSVGTPMISWIAMGLMDDGPAEGWYNFYNRNIYWDNNCNTCIATELSKNAIASRLDYMAAHPRYSLHFFYKKMISQWGNPSFEALNNLKQSDINNPNTSAKRLLFKKILLKNAEGKSLDRTHFILNMYLKLFELSVIVGTIIFILKNKLTMPNCIFLIIFIGGILFHLMWEAACQYMLLYFIVLIPYGVTGLSALGNTFSAKIKRT